MPPILGDRRESFYPRQCGLHFAAREVNLRDYEIPLKLKILESLLLYDLLHTPLLSVSAENNLGWLYHKIFTKNLDFSHSVGK